MSEREERIDAFLEANQAQYISEVIQLCSQPSVSTTMTGLAECAKLVARLLEDHGLKVSELPTPGAPVIVGQASGRSARTLLFYNHYDVQPAEVSSDAEDHDRWQSPPFEPEIRDGALYARGAKDDKGELVARLAALDAVRTAHDGDLPCGVTFVVEGQEEVASPHIAQFVLDHLDILKCDGAIWEEGGINSESRPINSLGKRGALAVEFRVETLLHDAHSGNASALPNAAWRLLWALASLKGPDESIKVEGFYDQALPPSELDLQLLANMPSDEEEKAQEFGVSEFLRGATGDKYKAAVFEPTCNIEGITTGYQGDGVKTIIPARATAKLDFRLVPDQDPRDIFHKLRRHLDKEGFNDVKVKWIGAMWPAKVPADDPLVKLTARAGEEVYGKPSVLIPLTGGSSPVYAFAGPLNIPVVEAGVGYPGSRTHAPNEHIRLSDFLNAARHIARILDGFADLESHRA